jgi:hypothetical protein
MVRYIYGAALCLSVFFSGCALTDLQQKKTAEPSSEATVPPVVQDDESAPDVHYTYLDTLNKGNELQLSDVELGGQATGVANDMARAVTATETRYRVQLIASSRIETLREQKKEIEKKISEPVVIGYEAPYYKLFAGNFLKRQDAQVLLPKVKRLGFQDAWVVSTKVVPEN